MSQTKVISEETLDAAFLWAVKLHSGTADQYLHDAFTQWLAESPQHKQAWQQVQLLESEFSPLKSLGKKNRHVLEKTRVKQTQKHIRFGSVLSVMLLLLVSGYVYTSDNGYWSDYSNLSSQPKSLVLASGTKLWLNSNTRLDIDKSGERNHISVFAGELLLDTTSVDPAKKPVIDTEFGSFSPVGTRFNIAVDDQASRLAVIKGRVKAHSNIDQQEEMINAGRFCRLTDSGGQADASNGLRPGSWTTGVIEANNASLQAVIEQLSTHHKGVIRYDDSVADYKVTGIFYVNDTETALKALANSLPINLRYYSNYIIYISAK